MMVKLIIRNLLRGFPRVWPMALALTLSLALLVLGNSISQVVSSGLEHTYTQRITGHGSISLSADQSFTIFGSEALLVGELVIPPLLPFSSQIFTLLEQDPTLDQVAGAIPVAARVEIQSRPQPMALLGVDFADYPSLVPAMDFILGGFPSQDQPGILLHQDQYHQFTRARGTPPQLGDPVIISAAQQSSFTIRELPLAGVFTHPVQDQALSRFGLIDAETARALNGFLYGAIQEQDLEFDPLDDLFATDQDISLDQTFDSDPFSFDNLFATDGFLDPSTEESPDLFLSVESILSEPGLSIGTPQIIPPRTGVYTFILLRFTEPWANQPQQALTQLQRSLAQHPQAEELGLSNLDFRLWRSTAGGVAVAVWIIQILFTLGLGFVALGAVVVTVNSLILSILERTKEIGTMRALGAQKPDLAWMITGETLILVSGSGLVGVLLGSGLVLITNWLAIPLENPLFRSLFQMGTLQGHITGPLLASHLVLSVVFGILAALYPLKKALGITPGKAMSSQ